MNENDQSGGLELKDSHLEFRNENQDDDDESSLYDEKKKGLLPRLAEKHPRTYNIVFCIVIPLYFLVVLCVLCGHFLAKFESPVEKASNDRALAKLNSRLIAANRAVDLVTTYENCLSNYTGNHDNIFDENSDLVNVTMLNLHMENCTASHRLEVERTLETLKGSYYQDAYSEMSVEWIICKDENMARNYWFQMGHIIKTWMGSFYGLQAKYMADGMAIADATTKANEEATGSDDCVTHTAGGALFWFTIMTTVGYGNTAPVTDEGRALVYTLGFLSILTFTACISYAGYVSLEILDDLFMRINLERLTKNFAAVILHLALFIVGMLLCCGISAGYLKHHLGYIPPFKNMFWFVYITGTTVGFGDIHILHDTFRYLDLLYIPPSFLLLFVLLANFLYKLSDFLAKLFEFGTPALDGVLSTRREIRRQSMLAASLASADDEPQSEKAAAP